MAYPKLVVGKFVRLTRLMAENLSVPVWGHIVWATSDGVDADVDIFIGVEYLRTQTILAEPREVPVEGYSGEDEFKVYTLNRLPQHALTAWVKHQLIEGEN